MAIQIEKCPFAGQKSVDRPKISLTHDPYVVVRAVFADFTEGRDFDTAEYPTNKPTIFDKKLKGSSSLVFTPAYEVRSVFSPDQQRYLSVVRTRMLMLMLMQGNPLTDKPHEPFPTLSDRIQTHMLEQAENPSLMEAIVRSNMDLVADFAELYPNLIPALQAYYLGGGSSGTIRAATFSRFLLDNELEKQKGLTVPEVTNIKERVTLFANVHPIDPRDRKDNDRSVDFEIQCRGINLAQSIYDHARNAAATLSQNTHIQEKYNLKADFDIDNPAEDNVSEFERFQRLRDQVKQLYEEAETRTNEARSE